MSFLRNIFAPINWVMAMGFVEWVGPAIGAVSAISGLLGGGSGKSAERESKRLARTQRAAIQRQMDIGNEQWDIWKRTYLPYMEESVGAQRRLLPTQEEAQETALRGDITDRETYEQVVSPVLNQIIDDAMAGVEDRSNYVVSQAAADVGTQFGVMRDQTQRELQRRGVNPQSGAARGALERGGAAEAGARAREVNRAREDESRRREDMNFQRRKEAYSLGSPLRQARFAGGSAQSGGLSAGTGSATIGEAGRQAGAGSRQAWNVAQDYGDVYQGLGDMAGYFLDRYGGAPGEAGALGGAGTTGGASGGRRELQPALPSSAGVSRGASGYPDSIYREF